MRAEDSLTTRGFNNEINRRRNLLTSVFNTLIFHEMSDNRLSI